MIRALKISIISYYFILFYLFNLYDGVANLEIWFITLGIEFIYLLVIIYFIIKNKLLYPSIFMKIIIFTVFLFLYFMIEQSIIKIELYGVGGGVWIRYHIYEQFDYALQWYEVLFWNFVFSLHYPVYIFIFFKPFVNHLDKSIKKIKAKKLEKLMSIKSVVDNRINKK